MASTHAAELAHEVLESCLRYGTWPSRALDDLIERALDEDDPFVAAAATRALFTVLVERLADLFEPRLCEVYSRLFSRIIARTVPDHDAADLALRYRRISRPRRYIGGEINRIYVLSRVTLGADIAVTSVVLDGMRARFPGAEVCFVGPAKNAELFAADPTITSIPIDYRRTGTLRERLVAAVELRGILDETGTLVIDPDSRLTQLGLIPVCDDSRYYFFESRAFGGSSNLNLPRLTAAWLDEVFGYADAKPFVAPASQEPLGAITLSWGVGENEDKRLGDAFEMTITKALLAKGATILLDCGAGGAEKSRARQLREECGSPLLRLHEGTYSSFASQIISSKLYVGYDSVGQHVAAAAGVPLISIFAGYPCERMFERWRPIGNNIRVIGVEELGRDAATGATLEALESLQISSLRASN